MYSNLTFIDRVTRILTKEYTHPKGTRNSCNNVTFEQLKTALEYYNQNKLPTNHKKRVSTFISLLLSESIGTTLILAERGVDNRNFMKDVNEIIAYFTSTNTSDITNTVTYYNSKLEERKKEVKNIYIDLASELFNYIIIPETKKRKNAAETLIEFSKKLNLHKKISK